MLLKFMVENYGSIKEQMVLSLEPTKDKGHEENISRFGKYKGNNVVSVCGANASGKSNLYKAMTMALVILRSSNLRQITDLIPVVPFKFDDESYIKPTRFEFQFIAKDGIKYVYGYSVDTKKVYEEYLYYYKSSKPSMIFDRSQDGFKFSRREKNI